MFYAHLTSPAIRELHNAYSDTINFRLGSLNQCRRQPALAYFNRGIVDEIDG